MLSSFTEVSIRSPPITSGYSRSSSPLTFSSAARIACAFSSLLKSVNGSFLNSVGIANSNKGFSKYYHSQKAVGRRHKAESRYKKGHRDRLFSAALSQPVSLLPSAFCLLPSAFCLLLTVLQFHLPVFCSFLIFLFTSSRLSELI